MLINRAKGFTLVEMAVVLLVMGLLAGSAMQAGLGYWRSRQYRATSELLESARAALIGYALTQNRLPCPADPALAATEAEAGNEARQSAGASAGRCRWVTGDLPWRALGLPETDAWGRRLQYAVTTDPMAASGSAASYGADFAGSNPAGLPACGVPGAMPCFGLNSGGNLTIHSASRRNGAVAPARKQADFMVAVVFSSGETGAGPAMDELENRDGDRMFIQDAPDADFDDQLVWLSMPELAYRLVQAGKLH